MSVFRIEISPLKPVGDATLLRRLCEAGLEGVDAVEPRHVYFLEGALERGDAERAARNLLIDPVTERFAITGEAEPAAPDAAAAQSVEVHLLPGVMDPAAESTHAALRAAGYTVSAVRTARRYCVRGRADSASLLRAGQRVLANDCIERIIPGASVASPAAQPPIHRFALRQAALRGLDAAALERLSRDGHLFLSLEEMQAIQRHFADLGREPTDIELETLAQTWSEHCVHKTLKAHITYRGAALPGDEGSPRAIVERVYDNLLKSTIAAATAQLMRERRGPECLSVFADNAGIIAFDDDLGIAFKVETHNHPSAIEPYGGAATGVGGCIRDVIGCGLGARPIANSDVFCVAPSDWPYSALPRGVLHPGRVLRGVVRGVADYGNRMGIPTVNGAVHFDPRYLGNPLVYCGCVGVIPRDRIHKAARPGDRIVVIGGRTGRDGIHGATFSSAELTESHADEFSHAVQIGNAITEKRVLDAVLAARDAEGGCLYSAITDCGAGGLSSAIGEMAAEIGAEVELRDVPLKYPGLRYDEIWISEAQERMVLAVPPARLEALLRIARDEEAEATVIGTFGHARDGAASLVVRYDGALVADLDMEFLHNGLPRRRLVAEWSPAAERNDSGGLEACAESHALEARATAWPRALLAALSSATVASKAWIVRQYDHEVQGGSVVKPLCGPGRGPSDGAVLRPRAGSPRGFALGCGLAPQLFERDPYWMAAAAIDEAIRNVVCVGGDPAQTAILDNFCWGRSDDAQNLGGLVRACQACHDAALAYGTPFISGKDSLNNEFALDPADVPSLLQAMRAYALRDDLEGTRLRAALPRIEQRIRATGRLGIPGTLLISALSIVADVNRCVTADLKRAGAGVFLVGGLPQAGFDLAAAARIHAAVAAAIRGGQIAACHDASDGGWLTALAEMALAGGRGVALIAPPTDGFEEHAALYVVEARDAALEAALRAAGVAARAIGVVTDEPSLRAADGAAPLDEIRRAWQATPFPG